MSRNLFSRQLLKVILLGTLATVAGRGQDINLSGKVTDSQGAAVAGAKVALARQNLEAVTDASGAYQIRTTIADVLPLQPTEASFPMTLAGGMLTFYAPTDDYPLTVKLYTVNGAAVSDAVNGRFGRGVHRVPIHSSVRLADGVFLIRIWAGQRLFCERALMLESSMMQRIETLGFSAGRPVAKSLRIAAAVDTLIVSHDGYTTSRVALSAYTGTVNVVLQGADPYAAARQACVDRINELRATIGMGPLLRNTAKDFCADAEAAGDAATNQAHGNFGDCGEWAQNECPGWGSPDQISSGCVQMMWDEGPGEPYSEHGHYLNMTSTSYSKISIGFAKTSSGKYWCVMNFY
jgi:hypothetical protein